MENNKIIKMADPNRYISFKEMKSFFSGDLLHAFNVDMNVTNEELMEIHNIMYDFAILINKDPIKFIKEYLLSLLTDCLKYSSISLDGFVETANNMNFPDEIVNKIKCIHKVI